MSPSRFRLRRVFRKPVQAIARPLARLGVRPDTITYLTLLLSMCAFFSLVIFQAQVYYGILVFLVGFFDGVDGAVARLRETAKPAGPLVDSMIDKVSEAILLVSIPLAYPSSDPFGTTLWLLTYLCLTGWLLTSYSRSRAENLGVKDLDVGLGARSERLFILVIMSVISLLYIGLILVTILGVLTAAYRFHHYRNELDALNTSEDG